MPPWRPVCRAVARARAEIRNSTVVLCPTSGIGVDTGALAQGMWQVRCRRRGLRHVWCNVWLISVCVRVSVTVFVCVCLCACVYLCM